MSKKKKKIKDFTFIDILKMLRIPIAPPSFKFKDKKKYNRKQKHKKDYNYDD